MQSVLLRFEQSFKEQKPETLLFGDDGLYCFVNKTTRDYESEKWL